MDKNNPDLYNWFVLHTKSRFERVVADCLDKKKIKSFLPTTMVLSKRKDRKKIIEVPMFPGYIFVFSNFFPKNHLEILKTNGAVRLLGTENGPVPVKKNAIESLMLFSSSNELIETGKGFKKGEEVLITDGPFTGVRGLYEKKAGKNRVIVQVDILGQYAYTEVEEDNIEFLNEYSFIA